MSRSSIRITAVSLGAPLLLAGALALGWWGLIGSARVPPLPPPAPDEGQEVSLQERYLQELVTRHPAHWKARLTLASILSRDGQDAEAVRQLREVSRVRAADPSVWLALAQSAERANLTDDELRAWVEVSRLAPQYALPHVHLATLYWRLGWYALARRAAAAALARAPRDLDALRVNAMVDYTVEDLAGASRSAQQMLVLDPNNAVAHSVLSRCYSAGRRWEEAEKEGAAAVRAEPQTMEYRVELARLFLDRADGAQYDKALAALGSAPAGSPEEELARRYWRGVCFQRRGEMQNAISELAWVAERNPEYQEVAYHLANAYEQHGDTQRARALTRSYQTLLSKRMELRDAEAALRRNMGDPQLHLQVARAALRSGDAARAVLECRVALRLRPKSAAAEQLLQQALQKAGQADAAKS